MSYEWMLNLDSHCIAWITWLLHNLDIINLIVTEWEVQTDSKALKAPWYYFLDMALWQYYTLTGHFIRDTLLGPGWTHVCLQNCLNSSWHIFNEVLETFLRDFGSYCHDSITQLLQICRLHIHDENLSFHHIPKVLYWIEIWWLWRTCE